MTTIEQKINFFFKYRLGFLPKILSSNKKILFYPQLPHHRTIIFKVCKQLGIKIVTENKDNINFVFFWDDKTHSDEFELPEIKAKSINRNSTDISKEKVDKVFANVFGYDLSVDPLTYNGKCVIKSNENAQHDGKLIECPVKVIKENVVYQKIIDNIFDDESVLDLRVPILGNNIPFVYYKFKILGKRFTNDLFRAELHKTEDVFSAREIKNILTFAKEMKLDYGELDVLRDKNDYKIYIVDVNKTPWGPPATLSKEDCAIAIKKMIGAFEKSFYTDY